MNKEDTITLEDLEGIANKINSLSRPMDINSGELVLDEKEERIVKALGVVGRMALHGEFKRLDHYVKNHHHVTLNVSDGMQFRQNGNFVPPSTSVFDN